MAEIPRGPTTKEKLASIVHGFDEFDTEMKRGTRVSLNIRPATCTLQATKIDTIIYIYSNVGRKMSFGLRS